MTEKPIQDALGLDSGTTDGPVECLGQAFESEKVRREHYLGLLREKLKDPEFRSQPGFPIGEDEDILALSDPPFFTACPNPWINEYVECYGTPLNPSENFHREPFATDVSEGKNQPIYNAHSYHTKVPHRAIMRYILHYTEPGDIVFDGFCGTGMTGIAAQLCGNRKEVQALGYHIDKNERILNEQGLQISKLGVRHAVISDLSPAAAFIAHNYNTQIDLNAFQKELDHIFNEIVEECSWMYLTEHTDGRPAKINYTIWSDVFTCNECGGEVIFWDNAIEESSGKVRSSFPCPNCSASLTKRSLERAWVTKFDKSLGQAVQHFKQVPALINYTVSGKRWNKRADDRDLDLIQKIEENELTSWYPTDAMMHGEPGKPWGDEWRPGRAFTHIHHLLFHRSNCILSRFYEKAIALGTPNRSLALLILTAALQNTSRMYRWRENGKGGTISGTFYLPSTPQENNVVTQLRTKAQSLIKALSVKRSGTALVGVQSLTERYPVDSVMDYVFLDPPFGSNLAYSELNFLWESWLKVFTNTNREAIENKTQKKGLPEYRKLMVNCFREAYRVLKPGRWMTVEFSNTKSAVWNSIQSALSEAGFIVANVSALDKKQRSFKAVTTTTAVKQDLVISAYKPNRQLELNFSRNSGSHQGVWDFIEYHLRKLPVVKIRGGQLEPITERDPRILFDRTIAFFVSHETPVPISSAEFQKELDERHAKREGLIYLADQVPEYDSAHAKLESVGQMTIFVEDEKSAISWLRTFLKKRPSTYQDIQPEFMQQLSASWKKWESRPELSFLLDQAFLQYKGDGPVPSQIHNYLSTQFKNLRNLGKEDPGLKAKAMDRWYVPDPSKQKDMDELRERKLLEEFWSYLPPNYVPPALSASTGGETLPGLRPQLPKIPKGKKLKELRTEAIRVGFRFCYQKKDYRTMLLTAQIVPDAVIEEDELLQLLFDNAVTRSGVED